MDPYNVSTAAASAFLPLLSLDQSFIRTDPGSFPDDRYNKNGTEWDHERPPRKDRYCCDDWQWESLVVIGSTALFTLFLWNSTILAPFKLIAVFLHEFSHALATWLTCGKVITVEINENYGGFTKTEGGVRWVILSAGYTGSVAWGSFFILMSWKKGPTRLAATLFTLVCGATALVLRMEDKEKKKNTCCGKFRQETCLRICIAVLGIIPPILWLLESFEMDGKRFGLNVYPLRWFILNTGTMCTLHAVYDCLHDVLFKQIDDSTQGTSDAVLFANEFYGTPRGWGLLWSLISLVVVVMVLFGVFLLEGNYELF